MSILRAVRPVDDDRRSFVEPGPFPHLARLVDLPPLTAQAAFDAVRVAHSRSPRSREWTLPVRDGRLELSGPGFVPNPPRPCYWSFREVEGKIRSQRWHFAVPVRLLLLPWSDTRCAVAVELRRQPWLYAAEHFYLEAGHEAIRTLASELEDWVLAETRQLYDALSWPAQA